MDSNGNLSPEERVELKKGDAVIYQTPRMSEEARTTVWMVQRDGYVVTVGNGSKLVTASDHLRRADFVTAKTPPPEEPEEKPPVYEHEPLPPRRSVVGSDPVLPPESSVREKSLDRLKVVTTGRTASDLPNITHVPIRDVPKKGTPEYRALWIDIVQRVKNLQESGLYVQEAVDKVAQDSPIPITIHAYKRWNTELMLSGEVPASKQSGYAYRRNLAVNGAEPPTADPTSLKQELAEARRAGEALSRLVQQHDEERKKLEAQIRDLKAKLHAATAGPKPESLPPVPRDPAIAQVAAQAGESLNAFIRGRQPGLPLQAPVPPVAGPSGPRGDLLAAVMKAVIALYEGR